MMVLIKPFLTHLRSSSISRGFFPELCSDGFSSEWMKSSWELAFVLEPLLGICALFDLWFHMPWMCMHRDGFIGTNAHSGPVTSVGSTDCEEKNGGILKEEKVFAFSSCIILYRGSWVLEACSQYRRKNFPVCSRILQCTVTTLEFKRKPAILHLWLQTPWLFASCKLN